MPAVVANGGNYTGRTAWARSIPTPLRACLTTETGGAVLLLAAALSALGWVNVHAASYEEQAVTGAYLPVAGGIDGHGDRAASPAGSGSPLAERAFSACARPKLAARD